MRVTTRRNHINGLDGRPRALTVPLIRTPGRPHGGWGATVTIRDQPVPVPGTTPQQVYNAAVTLLGRNGITVPPAELWASLNLQWLQRTPEKYHLVPLAELLSVTAPVKPGQKDSRRVSYKPSDWGAGAWKWLNLFLARESYNFREFLLQCQYVLDMLNPDTNPRLGCAECYRDFIRAVELLKAHPEWSQHQAREWVWNIHNTVSAKIGKRTLQWEEASKAAFWT